MFAIDLFTMLCVGFLSCLEDTGTARPLPLVDPWLPMPCQHIDTDAGGSGHVAILVHEPCIPSHPLKDPHDANTREPGLLINRTSMITKRTGKPLDRWCCWDAMDDG
jgi:hypothetical protein